MKTSPFFKPFTRMTIPSLLLSTCGSSAGPSASVAKSDLARVTSPDVSLDDMQTLVQNNNNFASDLCQSVRTQDGNLIYSPYSISLALAITSPEFDAGGDGATQYISSGISPNLETGAHDHRFGGPTPCMIWAPGDVQKVIPYK